MIYIFVGLILLGILVPKSNIIALLDITFLGWLSLISINIADFNSYQGIYYAISKDQLYQTGYGWYLLNSFGRNLGLTFIQFKTILVIISLILLFITIKYFVGQNLNYIWALYLLYPSLINITQIRFAFAMSLVLFGLIFLFQKKLWSTIIYILIVLAATTIHTAIAYYLLLLLIPIIEKRERLFSQLLIIITICLLPFKSFLQQIVSVFANTRQTSYFDNSQNLGSTLIMIGVVIVFWLLSKHLDKIIGEDIKATKKEKEISKFISNINLCMLFILPLLSLSIELARVQRISWVLVYIQLGIFLINKEDIELGKIKVNNKVLGLIIGLFGFFVLIMYMAPLAFTSIFS